jgi:hypothetical protein
MKPSALKTFCVLAVTVIGLSAAPVRAATDSLVASIEGFFSALKEDFNGRASSAIVKSTREAQLGAYFAGFMKKNPSLSTVMKVDAKGRVVCERSRGKKPQAKKRSVAQVSWFLKTSKELRAFDCTVVDKTGRASLYWCVPLLREAPGGGAKRPGFGGVFVAVVGMKDCFNAIARAGAQPFVIRLNNKTFYEHSWKSKMIFVENQLAVPGVETMTVRYQKSDVSTVAQAEAPPKTYIDTFAMTAEASLEKKSPDSSSAGPETRKVSAAKKNMPFIVSLFVLIIVVTVLLIIQIADRIGRRRSSRPGGKPDIL